MPSQMDLGDLRSFLYRLYRIVSRCSIMHRLKDTQKYTEAKPSNPESLET